MPLSQTILTGSCTPLRENTLKLDACIVTIDQGSSGTKALAFDPQARMVCRSSRLFNIERPLPGHAEQDPLVLLEGTQKALTEVLTSVHADGYQVSAIGLACQRSSFLFWDRRTGEPLTPIISWQDLRAKPLCETLISYKKMIYEKTGLPLTGHYGGPKFLWFLQNRPETVRWIETRNTVFSPWNSFLLWHLTQEKVCATDESIAGRSLLFNIHQRGWDPELLHLFNTPVSVLPEIFPTCHLFGHYRFGGQTIPILCSVGDHQGALLGLGGFEKGQCGINYGTSAGVLVNLGSTPLIEEGLLTNIGYSDSDTASYVMEGTVNAVGSLFEWFEKERGILEASKNWEALMASSSEGWYMIPGMYGIAAPYWKESAATEFVGKGGSLSKEIELRAGMESIAYLITDILDRIQKLPGFRIERIMASGGAARAPLLQFQADLLGMPVRHTSISDATALGCAFLTGLSLKIWDEFKAIRPFIREEEIFYPMMSEEERKSRLEGWRHGLKARGIFDA